MFFTSLSGSHLQIGVGGYSFAVNNNGHLLYHPDLRPMVMIMLVFLMGCLVLVMGWLTWIGFSIVQLLYLQFSGEILKPNYNSVDMVEVELVDDPSNEEPRQNSSELFLVSITILSNTIEEWGSAGGKAILVFSLDLSS